MPDDQVKNFRSWNLALAESIDAWRCVPRLLVADYGYLTSEVVKWYMNIEAKVIPCVTANAAKVCTEPGVRNPLPSRRLSSQ